MDLLLLFWLLHENWLSKFLQLLQTLDPRHVFATLVSLVVLRRDLRFVFNLLPDL